MGATSDPWLPLADPQAPLGVVEQALADLTVLLLDRGGPTPAASEAVPRLVEVLSAPDGSPVKRTAVISLLSRLALGECPWPTPPAAPAHAAVREALRAEVPRLLPGLEGPDARSRHLLAHLLAWLGPSSAIDAGIRARLALEKYEAVRASLLLAIGVRFQRAGSGVVRDLLHAQIEAHAPLRVVAAASIGLCLLDPAARADPAVSGGLRRAVDSPELASTELAWNRGDLRAMAEQICRLG